MNCCYYGNPSDSGHWRWRRSTKRWGSLPASRLCSEVVEWCWFSERLSGEKDVTVFPPHMNDHIWSFMSSKLSLSLLGRVQVSSLSRQVIYVNHFYFRSIKKVWLKICYWDPPGRWGKSNPKLFKLNLRPDGIFSQLWVLTVIATRHLFS